MTRKFISIVKNQVFQDYPIINYMKKNKKTTSELISQILGSTKKNIKKISQKKPRQRKPKQKTSKKRKNIPCFSQLQPIYKLINHTQLKKVQSNFFIDKQELLPTILNILKDVDLKCIHQNMRKKIYIKILPSQKKLGSQVDLSRIDKFFNYDDLDQEK